jgi:hypothetical protein
MNIPAAAAMTAGRAMGWPSGVAPATGERMAGAAASCRHRLAGGDATAGVAGRGVSGVSGVGPLVGDPDFPASNALTRSIALPSLPAHGRALHTL